MKIRWMFLFLAALMALSLSLAIACGGGGDDDDDDDDAVDDDDDDSDDDDADDDDDDDDDDSDDDDDDDDDDAEPTFCNTENSPPGDWTVEFYSVDGDDETMKVKPYVFSEEEEIQVHLTYTDPDCGEEVGGMNGGALIIETPENPLPGNEHSVLVKFATGEDEDAPL